MSQDDRHSLPADVEQLTALLLAERTQHADAITQHADAITQHADAIATRDARIAQQAGVISAQHDTIATQQQTVANLEQQLTRLLRKQYGPQRERIDPNQLTLFSAEEIEQLAAELQNGADAAVPDDDGSDDDSATDDNSEGDGDAAESGSGKKRKRTGHGRSRLPDDLPRDVVLHELTDAERTCPGCGELRQIIGCETSVQLEFVPGSLKAVEHQRQKCACKECEEHVAIATKPPQPIEKGLAGPGLLAHVVLSKYGDYLPLYRQEDILSRYGIIIRRSTLCDWVAASADLVTPLYHLMCDRVRASHVIHTDDTSIKMLAPGGCLSCKFWTYLGDAAHPYAVYEFSQTREGKEPSRFLAGFEGYLQADAFSGYDQVYGGGRIIEVACMAHDRRYWWEAKETDAVRAHEALSYIGRLYALEEQFEQAKLEGDSLRDARQTHAVPILNDFEAWLEREHTRVLPKSLIGKAFTYTRNQWQALCRYTEDGALDIDNNAAERLMKLPAIGRKNFLFVGSEAGGDRAAILLSMVASAKHCGVDPWAWLNAVFRDLPVRLQAAASSSEPIPLTDLLPDAWLSAHPEHRWRIDDIRQKERQRSRQQKIARRRKH